MKRSLLTLLVIGVAGLGGLAGYALRARADGVPATQPLFYAGTLQGPDGLPAKGTPTLTVSLYGAMAGGDPLCTSPPTPVDLSRSGGHFRVPLGGAGVTGDCVQVVHANAELWAGVHSSDAVQTEFPRAKLGAVPYALEAERARTVSGLETPGKVLDQVNMAIGQGGALMGGGLRSVQMRTADAPLGPGGAAGSEANWAVACAAGESLLGGGCRTRSPGWALWISSPGENNPNQWTCYAVNRQGGSNPATATAYAICGK
jgi:hypothetical protein